MKLKSLLFWRRGHQNYTSWQWQTLLPSPSPTNPPFPLQSGGGAPLTGTPGSAIRSWVIPAVAVALGAVTATPAAAVRQWVNPAPSVVVGAVTATPLPASRAWTVPTPSVTLGDIAATPAPAVRSWSVPTPTVSLGDVAATPTPAVRSWVANDASLLNLGPQTATPLPAIRTWVAKDAVLIEPPAEIAYGGSPVKYKKRPGYHITVVVPPAIRDWVVPRVHVELGEVRPIPGPAARMWVVLPSDVLTAPDPDEELLILLLTEKG